MLDAKDFPGDGAALMAPIRPRYRPRYLPFAYYRLRAVIARTNEMIEVDVVFAPRRRWDAWYAGDPKWATVAVGPFIIGLSLRA